MKNNFNDILKEALEDAKHVRETTSAITRVSIEEGLEPSLKYEITSDDDDIEDSDLDELLEELENDTTNDDDEDNNEDENIEELLNEDQEMTDDDLDELLEELENDTDDIEDSDLDELLEELENDSNINESKIKLSDLLKSVVNGETSEGVKISKKSAQSLLNLYNSKLISKQIFDNLSLLQVLQMLNKSDIKFDLKEELEDDMNDNDLDELMEELENDTDDIEDSDLDELLEELENDNNDIEDNDLDELMEELKNDTDEDNDLDELLEELENDTNLVEPDEDIDLDELFNEVSDQIKLEDKTERKIVELTDTLSEAKKQLKNSLKVIDYQQKKLNDINLMNSKLLYTNKILEGFNLDTTKRKQILKTFESATSINEAKVIYDTLNKNLNESKNVTPNKHINEQASRIQTSTKPIISNVNNQVSRFQVLAGIIKNN